MEFGRRQVNATAVHVGVVAAQTERLRADDAAVDDERFAAVEVGTRGSGVAAHGFVGFEFLKDGELGAAEHSFSAVVEARLVGVLRVGE